MNCNSQDVHITGMAVVGDTTSCVGGTNVNLDLQVTMNFAQPNRYDIGIFVSQDGKDPAISSNAGGAASCSVTALPTSSPFLNLDGDSCGDGDNTIGGGTGSGIHYIPNVTVPCKSLGTTGNLYIPFTVTWDTNAQTACSSNLDVEASSSSKCNSPTIAQGTVAVVVLPSITKTDGITTIASGDNTNYTLTLTNTTGMPLSNVVLTDPAVTGIAVNSLACAAAGGATCPASSTVAAIQGAGITIPTMPVNGSVTYTINATLTGNPSDNRTNTARVAVGTQSNSASDTDIIVGQIAILPSTQANNGDQNSSITYSYTLYNYGASTDTISLAATSSRGWTITRNPTSVSVPAGGSATVTVKVDIPSGATVGDVDTTTLTATSGNNPSKTAIATAVTTVTTVLTLTPSNTSAGGAGSYVYYTHRVQSNSSAEKSVSLTPSFTGGTCTGWTSALFEADKYTVLASPVTLAANGGYKDFVLKVGIPIGAALNSTCTATLAAAYTSGPANTASVTDVTSVKILVLYQDPGYTKEQYTYPAGNNVYAKSYGLTNGTPYYYKWFDPSGNLMRTSAITSNLVSLPDTYSIPTSGPLGTWTVQLWNNTTNTIFVQSNFYVGPDHLKANYTGAMPSVNTDTVVDLALHDRYNHVVPLDVVTGSLVTGNPLDIEGPLLITVSVSGSAQIISTTLSNATITGQSVTGKLSGTTGTATLTIRDSVGETVTITPVSYKSALYGSPLRDEPGTVTYRLAPSTVTKSYGSPTIGVNGVSTQTVTITNPNSAAMYGLAFTDTYPSTNLKNASVPALTNTCGGTATGTAGSSVLSLSGGSVPGNSSCSVSVNVTSAVAGSYLNDTGTVSSTNAGSGTAATATLTVTPVSAANSTVVASPVSVQANGTTTSTVTVTLLDGAGAGVLGKTVTLAAGSGSSVISAASGVSDAGGVVTFTVKNSVAQTVTYTATDTTDNVVVTQTADVTFTPMPAPTVTKSFSPTTIGASSTSTLTITIANPNAAAAGGLAFTDTYPSTDLKNAATPAITNTCGGTVTGVAGASVLSLSGGSVAANSSCSVSIKVTSAISGSYVNSTGPVSSSNASNGATASATLLVTTVALDHLRIIHDGEGSNCVAENITVEACANTDCSTLATIGGITATLEPFGAAVNIDISGSTTLTVNFSTAGTNTLRTSAISPTPTNAAATCLNTTASLASCDMAVSACPGGAFFNCLESTITPYNNATSKLYTKLVNVPFSFDVVALNASGGVETNYVVSGGTAKTVTVELFDDSTPAASCVAYAGPVASQSLSIGSANSGRKATANFNVTGAYKKLRCRVADANAAGCSSDDFSVRPQTFTVASTTANADGTGVSKTASPTIKAGANFRLTATAVAGYNDTPKIDTTKVQAHTGAVGNGTLAGSFGPADVLTGMASGTAFTYSEVGYFNLNIDGVYDNTFTSVDVGDCTADFSNTLVGGKYGCMFGNTAATSYFGRFIPDHFVITPGANGPGCGMFTYFGQDGFTTVFALTAQNASNATTANYVGSGSGASWAKLPLTSWGAAPASTLSPGFGFAASGWTPSQPAGTALAASATTPTATNSNTWSSGSTTVTAKHQITRPTSPAAPTTVNVTALPVDSDGVTMASTATLVTATPLRYGRLALQNAYGSELQDLPMPFTAEYWTGNSWALNADDQCTTGITLSAAQAAGPITTLCAYDTGTPGSSGMGCPVVGTSINKFSQPPVTGNFNLNFKAPGEGNTGAMDITAAVSAYLKFNWKGAGDVGPTARATFGVYKGNSKFIYIRENY